MNSSEWFSVSNAETLDSPSLLIYKDRVERNIQRMIDRTGGTERLIPHIKTNKMPAVVAMMLDAGITRFKCATVAEAEMLAMTGAAYILIAHQLVSPKTSRLLALKKKYPTAFIASLVDNLDTAKHHSAFFAEHGAVSEVFLDVNNGMNRSGTPFSADTEAETFALYQQIAAMPHLRLHGLHVYDGHIRDTDIDLRERLIESGFVGIEPLVQEITNKYEAPPMVIAGGTPAFSTHSTRPQRFCSPGTCVLWDWGYEAILPEQHYEYAALVLTRIISKPHQNLISVDMGHKAVAAENPIDKRVRFLNLPNYEMISQSEEHSVIRITDNAAWTHLRVGDALYGVPYHVCPTVNLYDEAYWVEHGTVTGTREVLARRRRITV